MERVLFLWGVLAVAICSGCTYNGAQYRITQNDLSCIAGRTNITEDVLIYNNNALYDLEPLLSLTRIYGSLQIYDNPVLESLRGLDHVTQTSSLTIMRNPNLFSLAGLENLERTSTFTVNNNGALQNINALAKLSYSSSFTVSSNARLTSVAGLCSLVDGDHSISISGQDISSCIPTNNHPPMLSCPCLPGSCPCCTPSTPEKCTYFAIRPNTTRQFLDYPYSSFFSIYSYENMYIGSIQFQQEAAPRNTRLDITSYAPTSLNVNGKARYDAISGRVLSPLVTITLNGTLNKPAILQLIARNIRSPSVKLHYLSSDGLLWMVEDPKAYKLEQWDEYTMFLEGKLTRSGTYAFLGGAGNGGDGDGDGLNGDDTAVVVMVCITVAIVLLVLVASAIVVGLFVMRLSRASGFKSSGGAGITYVSEAS